MTTIRERSTAALAEALTGYGGASDPMDVTLVTQHARSILVASPTLARRLDLGTAWDEAVAALPEGWDINVLWGTTTEDRWGAHAGPFPAVAGAYHDSETAGGDTPTEALVALAEALRERAR